MVRAGIAKEINASFEHFGDNFIISAYILRQCADEVCEYVDIAQIHIIYLDDWWSIGFVRGWLLPYFYFLFVGGNSRLWTCFIICSRYFEDLPVSHNLRCSRQKIRQHWRREIWPWFLPEAFWDLNNVSLILYLKKINKYPSQTESGSATGDSMLNRVGASTRPWFKHAS